MNTHIPSIQHACRLSGGQAALAKFLNLSPGAINQWIKGRRPIPPIHCVSIEREFGIPRKDLRPHDWQDIWPELADQ